MFIYLNELEHVTNWINGGIIPLNPASYYRNKERSGKFTPDENVQLEISGEKINPGIRDTVEQVIYNPLGTLTINGNVIRGSEIIGANIIYKQSHEDGLILSLSKTLSIAIFNKLGGKKAVVEIIDIEKLKSAIDSQIGYTGVGKFCEYTETENRNHFLKHKDDSWQEEYRLYWEGIKEPVDVKLPKGIAKDVTHQLLSIKS
jgi:hypothetical protein